MTIAIIGHGNVGGALGRHWEKTGRAVVYGSRDPHGASASEFRAEYGGNPDIRAIDGAVRAAEFVLLATPYPAAIEFAARHAAELSGKIVIDATNPIGPGLVLTVGHTSSGAEEIQKCTPAARVVKAFNTYGWENFRDAAYPGGVPAMFIAGDDAAACDSVAQLASAIGFRPVVAGGLTAARYLEPLAMLWIQMGRVQGKGAGFTWSMLER